MGDKIMAALKSNTAKVIYVLVMVLAVTIFSSWTTQKTMQNSLSDYAKYQFSESVRAVNNEPGGVVDQIKEVKAIAVQTQQDLRTKNSADFKDWIADMEKYYKWCKERRMDKLDSAYLTKMSNYWGVLPEEYKTPIVTAHYNYAFSFLQENCK